MTSAYEATIQGACDDLRRERDSIRLDLASEQGKVRRLNALLVTREKQIDDLEAANTRLQAELDEARAGKLKLPY